MASEYSLENGGGYLEVIFGPMYCGKTTTLIRRLNIFGEMDLNILYVNHSLDDRSEDEFSTHNKSITKLGKIDRSVKSPNLTALLEQAKEYDVIGIDEAQFFPDLKECVLHMVETMGKKVIVAGLNGDYRRHPFGQIIDLIPYVDELTKLKPFCSQCAKKRKVCRDALFTKRIVGGDEQILIGGHDQYVPVCRECYHE